MGEAAVKAAKAVGYYNAGTVEFIYQDGDFFFLEMNTRLQVEHPVTEAITGLDLVEWQLRVAAGQPLPLTQAQLRIDGHAIEARLCAENPDANFLPATGRLDVFRTPPAAQFTREAVRLDAGVREGDSITPYYDPMIAKLIVWGADREQALARLDAALAATHIVGLHTNIAFLRRVVASRSFAQADLDTALIERERAVLFDAPPLPLPVAAAGVVAHALAAERALEDADPWSRRDGWRLHGAAVRRFDLAVQGQHHVATLQRTHGGETLLAVGAERWAFGTAALGADVHDVTLGEQRHRLTVYAQGERISVFAPAGSAVVQEVDPIAHAGEGAVEGGRLTAPMPGRVVAFLAKPGDAVKVGQPLAVMEAMKMEHTISAPRDGTVAELLYAVGDQVAEGGELLRLEE
jgi:3-methylcrotonyl-CoA carboxylase alpha subunit